MMKINLLKIICLITGMLAVTNIHAQTATGGFVKYDAVTNKSLPGTNPSELGKDDEIEEAWLYFGGAQSLFYQKANYNTIKIVRSDQATERTLIANPNYDKTGLLYKKDFSAGTLKSRECFFNKVDYLLVKDTLAVINWTIKTATRKIGKFNCNMAEADYMGRHWIAWYTPEVAVSDGPWKLWGLPGLILEAYDSTKKFRFLFREIQVPYAEKEQQINARDKALEGRYVTKSEFRRLEARKKEDTEKYMRAKMSEMGAELSNVKFDESIEQEL